MPGRQIRVLVVDDHLLLAQTLAAALRANRFEVEVADLSDCGRLVARVRDDPPDLVLIDPELGGGGGDGPVLVRSFVEAGARVLLVSAARGPDRVVPAIEQGALGHVSKSAPFLELLRTALDAVQDRPVMTAGYPQPVPLPAK